MNRLMYLLFVITVLMDSCNQVQNEAILFSDDYSQLPRGPLGSDVGAHTEYHYLTEVKPKGNWAVSTFRYNLPASWYVRQVDDQKVIWQKEVNKDTHWHPMVIAGDVLWENYTINTSFRSLDKEKQCGIVFRYKNDRCYYFLGAKQDSVFIKMVKHGIAFRKPYEEILASQAFDFSVDADLTVKIEVSGDQLVASFENGPELRVTDDTYKSGKVAFLADGPAYFNPIKITSTGNDKTIYENLRAETNHEEQALRDHNPKPVLWKSIKTKDFGVGRNLRFGDLNNNGEIDVLIGQVIHHGPKDRNSELSCLTAMTFDGEVLWQKGKPDAWKNNLTNDVAFQIHDIDNDGINEVIYCMNQKIIVADGGTGATKYQSPTPLSPGGKPLRSGHNIFQRILGDCLYFCDLQGKGYDGDIMIKDRYNYIWAFIERNLLSVGKLS